MATRYALEFVGVKDVTPPTRQADGRAVYAKKRCIRATKDNVNALVATDKLYIGTLPVGAVLKSISAVTDTSFSTTQMTIGTLAAPAKYATGKTLTATDTPTVLGPNAAGAVQAPLTAEEDLYVTFSVTTVAAAVVAAFNTEYTIDA